MKYMLDTNICIYFIKGKTQNVMQKLKENMQGGLCISAITLAELEHGVALSACPEKNATALSQFLSIIDVLPFGDKAAAEYGSIHAGLQRNGTVIGVMDMLIAAHARAENMVVVTNNVREFERVKGLTIENWADSTA
jgi:tRNA(fMet)-specific endonuclease VapC